MDFLLAKLVENFFQIDSSYYDSQIRICQYFLRK